MDRLSATRLIGDTFNFPFDEGRFRNFAINLLNDMDEEKAVKFRGHIKHFFIPHIKAYRRLGTYTDPNGEKIDVLIVQLKNEWALERSRTMLRNFTSDYLKNRDEKDAALVAYYTTNPDDWRFSYIRMEYKREKTESGKFKIKQDITPAKRYSFLVGKNEPNHTAQSQLISILEDDRNNPTLSTLENAFSVDAVTKQFYKDYRSQFEKLWNELNDIVAKDPKIAEEFETKTIDTANFAKKLMGQIVFLYFLQKKGWLGVGKDENGNFKEWGTGPKNFLRRLFDEEFTGYGNFFNEVLEPLFYEALATERPNDIFSRFNCKIPFLNGGLFEPINDYNWEETDIRIDNDLIGDVFKTFDQYNFTVREDEPLEKEVAVDPEMLGKVFENLLPENLRKGKGAYYTPRTIVYYMCQESLINYLDTECEPAPKEDIETLIREGDIILELETAIVEEGKKYKSVLMDSIKENAQALDDALAIIKVCDPAIGSGAFPVGMLTEIIKARQVLELYLGKKQGVYELKRHCIQNSLYGVDIDPGAIEIAKLRLWLSLVVDEDDYTSIQPLPNLDYKIMQGNSLIEEFHGISLDIKKKEGEQFDAFSGGSDLDSLIDDLHQKQDAFFNAEHPREKKKKRDAVETAIYNIFHNELEKKKNISPQEAQAIATDLKEMTHGNKERNFFPWKLYFADVFREKGGFDVVIANPPYLTFSRVTGTENRNSKEINKIKKLLKKTYPNSAQYKISMYALFFDKGIQLLHNNCPLCFITPDSYLNGMYFSKLRAFFLKECKIIKIALFLEDFFQGGVVGFPTVSLYIKSNGDSDIQKNNYISTYRYTSIGDFNRNIYLSYYYPQKYFSTLPLYRFRLLFDKIDFEIVKRMENNIIPLSSLVNMFVGVRPKIGYDKIQSSEKVDQKWKKGYVKGNEVTKYSLKWNGSYINIDKQLLWSGGFDSDKVEQPKLLMRKTGNDLIVAYDKEGNYHLDILHSIIKKNDDTNLLWLLAILNSKAVNYYYKITTLSFNRVMAQTNIETILNLPIPQNQIVDSKLIILNLVDQIFTAKEANPQADTTALEAEIDQLVYELYRLTEEEIKIVEESVG